jgi:hypothetical protein
MRHDTVTVMLGNQEMTKLRGQAIYGQGRSDYGGSRCAPYIRWNGGRYYLERDARGGFVVFITDQDWAEYRRGRGGVA